MMVFRRPLGLKQMPEGMKMGPRSKVLSWKTLLHLTGSKPYFELCLAA